MLLAAAALAASPAIVRATDGTWSNLSGGNWSTATNWTSSVVANGQDGTANFANLNITTNPTVTVDTARTIGNMVFADATTFSNNWTLSGANTLTLSTNTGTPFIAVNSQSVNLNVALGGTQGFVKYGAATAVLGFNGTEPYSGPTTVNSGVLQLNGATTHLPSGGALTFSGNATFRYDNTGATGALNESIGSLNLTTGDATFLSQRTANFDTAVTFGSMTRSVGGTINFNVGGTGAAANVNQVSFTAAPPTGFINQGTFFGGSTYAYYDASGFVRSLDYTSDSGTTDLAGNQSEVGVTGTHLRYTPGTSGSSTASAASTNSTSLLVADATQFAVGQLVSATGIPANTRVTAINTGTNTLTLSQASTVAVSAAITGYGQVSAQSSETLNTLNIAGNGGSINLASGATLTLTNGGILRAGSTVNTGAVITGGTSLTSGSAEMVIRTDGANDNLLIATPITAGGLTHSGAGALTVSAASTLSGGITSNAGTLSVTGAATITGGGGVTVNGGTTVLSAANTYSGPTVVNSATLRLTNAGALGSSPSVTLNNFNVQLGNGSTLELQGSATYGTGKTLFMNGINSNGGNNYRTDLLSSSGTNTWAGNVVVTGDSSSLEQFTATAALNVTGNISAGAAGFTGILFVRGTNNGTISGNINLPNGLVSKTDGGTWTISGTNNVWTNTAVAVGTVKVGSASAIPATTVLTIGQNDQNAAVLDLNGFDQTIAGVTISNSTATTGTANLKQITNSSATAKTLTINNSSNFTFTDTNTFDQVVISGNLSLNKSGAGILTLTGGVGTGQNTYTGSTSITAGTLALGIADRLPDATTMILAGGTFSTGGFNETVGKLSITANSTINLGAGASILHFAASSGQAWTGGTTLTVSNWSGDPVNGAGTDQIYVGADATGLTAQQLSQITFTGFSPGAEILPTGEIVPAPEPGVAGLLSAGAIGLLARRRRRG